MTRETPPRRKGETADEVSESLVRAVCQRLRANHRVRRSLPGGGRVHIDRQLPFLCVYRQPASGEDAGTERLAASEASYLIGPGTRGAQPGLAHLVRAIAETLSESFGAFLVLELWAGPPSMAEGPPSTARLVPEFRIVAPRDNAAGGLTEELDEALGRVRLGGHEARVEAAASAHCAPRGLPPLLPDGARGEIGCSLYGLEIAPIYRDAAGEVYPGVLRELRHQLTVALRRAFFQFTRKHTTHRPPHYHTLGSRALSRAVWEVDRLLAEASEQFDFLLQVTPVNGEQAWQQFRKSGFARAPLFHYRPLPTDSVILKRKLYKAPVEKVGDPTLAMLFRQKIDEQDRQITILGDRNSPRFLHESIQLYGGVEDDLHRLAEDLLGRIPARSREEPPREQLSPEQFAGRARAEIAYLRRQHPQLAATVEVRPDVASLMVSRGNLLVSTQSWVPPSRVVALIQHEVGTHVLTYHNGRAQRFRQLSVGLAGYDALQEGLAVLAEYLTGGLSRPRLRLLAGRVIAARSVLEGASFVDTFDELAHTHGFARRTAFQVAMRIHRGGGLTKDAVYLRGLCQILTYLGQGGELEPLFIGKIALDHIPIVRELLWRGILREPPLTPRYMKDPVALSRLEYLRGGVTVADLVKHRGV